MPTYDCPKGHASTEPDFCSECGAKILGVSGLAISQAASIKSAIAASAGGATQCPDCTAPHDLDSGDFCEICGYNFVTGAHGELAISPPQLSPPASSTQASATVKQGTLYASDPSGSLVAEATPSNSIPRFAWEVTITVDPALRSVDSPLPPDLPPSTLRLDQSSHLIGRTSSIRAIHPEIALDFDDAVSHRHALLNCPPDGTLVLRDIGSSNGTQLNGTEIKPLTDVPLTDGDQVTLGHWTRIIVKAVPIED